MPQEDFSFVRLHALELHAPPWSVRQEYSPDGPGLGDYEVLDASDEVIFDALNLEEATFMARSPQMFALLARIARSPMSLRAIRVSADALVRLIERADANPPTPPEASGGGV